MSHQNSYMCYGFRSATSSSRIGFNGEFQDQLTGFYFLGNGYRAYCPDFCRFVSPDKLSPFQSGGLNSYAYVLGDPINNTDPTGRTALKKLYQSGGTKAVGQYKSYNWYVTDGGEGNPVTLNVMMLDRKARPKLTEFIKDVNELVSTTKKQLPLTLVNFLVDRQAINKTELAQNMLKQLAVRHEVSVIHYAPAPSNALSGLNDQRVFGDTTNMQAELYNPFSQSSHIIQSNSDLRKMTEARKRS